MLQGYGGENPHLTCKKAVQVQQAGSLFHHTCITLLVFLDAFKLLVDPGQRLRAVPHVLPVIMKSSCCFKVVETVGNEGRYDRLPASHHAERIPELLAATLSTGSKAAACKTNIPEIRNNVKIYLKFKLLNLICSVEAAFGIHTKIGTFCTN